MSRKDLHVSERLRRTFLDRIRKGTWPVGSELPSERELMSEFGVSRIPLREAIAGLRALGVLETRAGSGTRVKRVDADTVAGLLPLIVTLEGGRTFTQVFELRLSVESQTAFLAAQRRSDDDVRALRGFVEKFRAELDADLEDAVETDLDFHVRIAKATQNPLFEMLMRTLAELVQHVQVQSCKDDPVRRRRAFHSHEAIADAIIARDAERARAEMEAHLRYSASRMLAAERPVEEKSR
ncbi:MAG TPA: FadR/GntR family transcriptional regulator [Planctomycetota bacterium]|jgi:GntR family transcriptional repressor for pyruvate dehydrogenase complex|nr:FadR/GntR family transcriptional regulator [Planctomycetota bacterium]